jgi:predicted SprT family Zn-dependent metalloprotease
MSLVTRQQVIEKFNQIVNNAPGNFNADDVRIEFKNLGQTAGKACYSRVNHKVVVQINSQVFKTDDPRIVNHIVNDTIPHEIAHAIGFLTGSQRGHCRNWRALTIALGGTGSRCHSLPLARARQTRWAIYQVAGESIEVGATRHKRIQTGQKSYSFIKNGVRHQLHPSFFTGKMIVKT